MKVLNVAEVVMASGGEGGTGEEFNYWQRFTANPQYGYHDYTGLYDIFATLNQRPDFWGFFFASC